MTHLIILTFAVSLLKNVIILEFVILLQVAEMAKKNHGYTDPPTVRAMVYASFAPILLVIDVVMIAVKYIM